MTAILANIRSPADSEEAAGECARDEVSKANLSSAHHHEGVPHAVLRALKVAVPDHDVAIVGGALGGGEDSDVAEDNNKDDEHDEYELRFGVDGAQCGCEGII